MLRRPDQRDALVEVIDAEFPNSRSNLDHAIAGEALRALGRSWNAGWGCDVKDWMPRSSSPNRKTTGCEPDEMRCKVSVSVFDILQAEHRVKAANNIRPNLQRTVFPW